MTDTKKNNAVLSHGTGDINYSLFLQFTNLTTLKKFFVKVLLKVLKDFNFKSTPKEEHKSTFIFINISLVMQVCFAIAMYNGLSFVYCYLLPAPKITFAF